MKLISHSPKTPLRSPQRAHRGWFWRRLRSRAFSARTAWWVLVAIVAALAISVFRMLRSALEAGLQ
jgi:hypothetical protein